LKFKIFLNIYYFFIFYILFSIFIFYNIIKLFIKLVINIKLIYKILNLIKLIIIYSLFYYYIIIFFLYLFKDILKSNLEVKFEKFKFFWFWNEWKVHNTTPEFATSARDLDFSKKKFYFYIQFFCCFNLFFIKIL
jgi:hypothetical protein